MAWVMLGIAGIFEVVWATCMKYSEGFTKLSWSLLTFAGMAVSFYLLARATKTLPLGTAYAVWTGIGALGSVIVGIILFKEPVTAGRLCRSAACWHHWTEDHVGLIHTIILPRPARRCAAAGPERTARCAARR